MALSQQLILELLYKVSNTQELDKAKRDLESLGQKTEEVNNAQQGAAGSALNFSTSLSKIATVATAVATAVGVTAVAMDKFLDAAKEGAVISQTTDSFENFIDIVGAAPDVLEKLQAASRGTVADMRLMSSVMTMASGSSNELARELVNAAPQLMEIAKAASKLNPSIITTEQAFERLARGIKRSSPRILDDLGLLVKLGPAFENWAEQMDRSTASMSAEEKQLAILNAVLGMHGDIVSQVGGDMESQVDAFAALETASTNLSNAWKAKLAPAGIVLANALSVLLTGEGGLERISEQAFNASRSFEEFTDIMWKAGYAVSPAAEANYNLGKSLEAAAEAETRYYQAANQANQISQYLVETSTRLSHALDAQADHTAYVAQITQQLAAAEREAAIASAGLAAGLSGNLQKATEQYNNSLANLTPELNDVQAQYDKMHDAYIRNTIAMNTGMVVVEKANDTTYTYAGALRMSVEQAEALWQAHGRLNPQVQELEQSLSGVKNEVLDAADAFREATAQMVFNQAATNLMPQDALALANAMGLLSEQDYTVASAIESVNQQLQQQYGNLTKSTQGSEAFAGSVKAIYDAVGELQAQGVAITPESLQAALDSLAAGTTLTDQLPLLLQQQLEQGMGGVQPVSVDLGDVVTLAGGAEFVQDVTAIFATLPEAITESGLTEDINLGEIIGLDIFSEQVDELYSKFTAAKERMDAFYLTMRKIADTIKEAAWQTERLKIAIDSLKDKVVKITIITEYKGGGETSGGGDDGGGESTTGYVRTNLQHGANFIVPGGYPNDSFGPIYVSSGERVVVTPTAKTAKGESTRIVNMNIYQEIADEESAALSMAVLKQTYMDTLNGRI